MARSTASTGPAPRHVSIVALPEAVLSTLGGIYDVLNAAGLGMLPAGGPPPFQVDVVAEQPGRLLLASGVPFEVGHGVAAVAATDIVIVPGRLPMKPIGHR